MAPTAAFLLLLALMSDPFWFHQNGIIWAPNAPLLTRLRPILVIVASPHILYAGNTHNNYKIASLQRASRNHVHFKATASFTFRTMHPSTPPFKDPLLYEKHGTFIAPSLSTAALTASPVSYPEDDDAMLARKQSEPLYPLPGPRPTRSGLRPPTKTQVQADQKAEKAQKSEAKENEKLAAATRKIKLKEEKQERLILIAKERAKKASARADAASACADAARAAHLNLDEATRHKSGTVTPGTSALPIHSHKKSKGTVGSHSIVDTTNQQFQYQSPQRRSTTKNKRISVRSPKNCFTETLSVSSLFFQFRQHRCAYNW